MNLFYISDLHNELYRANSRGRESAKLLELSYQPDVIVLAGDIDNGVHAVTYANELSDKYQVPVIVVPGNHEYWKGKYPSTLHKMQEAAHSNVHVLNNQSIVIDDVRFVGSTLWTDGCLFGKERLSDVVSAIFPRDRYDEGMRDFLQIRRSDIADFQKIKPAYLFALHYESIAYLEQTLSEAFDGETVVVTHHSPSAKSLPEKYVGDIFGAAYASNLESMIWEHQPALWVHGHIHDKAHYTIGRSIVASNPGGGPLTNHLAEQFKGIELPCRRQLNLKR